MIKVGDYNDLKVQRKVEFGMYLDDGLEGLLLPKRFVPRHCKVGETIRVFVYHDGDNRLVATTQQPYGVVGETVKLRVVAATRLGAFLDWGLMKDLFVPKSQQQSLMRVGGEYLVKIYIDKQTGRVAATEKIDRELNNNELTVKEKDAVTLIVQRKTDLGYTMIINGIHIGLLHFSDVFRDLEPGETMPGYIKAIKPDNKIDVMIGKSGYAKVSDEEQKVLELLQQNNGYLPFNDKSEPEKIYETFGVSKKTFKMACGSLYKQKKIEFAGSGIRLLE
jgi:hypothetical protein